MLETTAVRIWKRLLREERVAAAVHFWKEPPEVMIGPALAAIVNARHLRPQVARALSEEERARALGGILDPGEGLASTLLVALHLGERRALLATFLDAVGLAHENGLLKDEATTEPVSAEAARRGVEVVGRSFPREQVLAYLNTLWLQDPERWAALAAAADWLGAAD